MNHLQLTQMPCAKDEQVKQAIDSTEAFTLVLCGLKAFLEHNIVLHLVADHLLPSV